MKIHVTGSLAGVNLTATSWKLERIQNPMRCRSKAYSPVLLVELVAVRVPFHVHVIIGGGQDRR